MTDRQTDARVHREVTLSTRVIRPKKANLKNDGRTYIHWEIWAAALKSDINFKEVC